MAVDLTPLPPRGAAVPAIPIRRRIYGFGSIYGKTLRDSRLAFIIMTGFFAGLMFVLASVWGSTYASAEARQELVRVTEVVPPVVAGIAGNPVAVDTMGGFLTYKYGPIFIFIAGLWSILALSSTLAGEARRASLDFVAAAPFGKRRIALEKLTAHVTVMAVAMAVMALAAVVASNVFGDAALGDSISPLEAAGFALWGSAGSPGSIGRTTTSPSSACTTGRRWPSSPSSRSSCSRSAWSSSIAATSAS
jgi:ABC-2 type transport system permease protein